MASAQQRWRAALYSWNKDHPNDKLTPAQVAVAFCLYAASRPSGKQYSRSSINRLAERTGADVKTVRKALARLAELGLIQNAGRDKNNVITWLLVVPPPVDNPSESSSTGGCEFPPLLGANSPPTAVRIPPPMNKNKISSSAKEASKSVNNVVPLTAAVNQWARS